MNFRKLSSEAWRGSGLLCSIVPRASLTPGNGPWRSSCLLVRSLYSVAAQGAHRCHSKYPAKEFHIFGLMPESTQSFPCCTLLVCLRQYQEPVELDCTVVRGGIMSGNGLMCKSADVQTGNRSSGRVRQKSARGTIVPSPTLFHVKPDRSGA